MTVCPSIRVLLFCIKGYQALINNTGLLHRERERETIIYIDRMQHADKKEPYTDRKRQTSRETNKERQTNMDQKKRDMDRKRTIGRWREID